MLAATLDTQLIRLQCYEGLDISQAVYEWNYARQILHIRLLETRGERAQEKELFGPDFLLKRPLLRALESSGENTAPVLLIDEIDRSDDAFEAYLLEVLSDFQITIPEIGTFAAEQPPVVILTSNRTREIHDALKRRCLYHWIEYPTFEKELEIVRAKIPAAAGRLAQEVTRFVQQLREDDLYKVPGIAETLDWTAALVAMDQVALSPRVVEDTLGVLLKYHEDMGRVRGRVIHSMLEQIELESASGRD